MKTRIIAGVTAALLLLALIYWGPFWLMTLVVVLCACLAYLEYDRLFFPVRGAARLFRVLTLICLTLLAINYDPSAVWIYLWLSFVFHCIAHVVGASRSGDPVKAVRDSMTELLGYVYVVSLFGFLVPIAEHGEHGRDYLLLLFILVFLGDTAAYFVGRKLGKRPLAPSISPKKTVEGAVGAIVATLIGAAIWLLLIVRLDYERAYLLKLLLFAPFANILAQFGDLFESLLKRSQAQKDSGSFLPGHGGILDRVDGLALAAPVFFFYLIFVLERPA